MVEKAGSSIKRQLQSSYLFKDNTFENKCFVCVSNGKGNCRRRNVNYDIVCTRQGCNCVTMCILERPGEMRFVEGENTT